MTTRKSSSKLLFLLGVTMLLAAFALGRPLLEGASISGTENLSGTAQITVPAATDPPQIERWVPPDPPRDPFVPVEFGPPASTATTDP